MNEQLQSVFVQEDDEVMVTECQRPPTMSNIVFEENEVLEMMKNLDVRKAMGPDEIACWILKECAEQLVKPVYHIINHSLETGRLPKDWKRANVVPIYKGGEKEDPLNYRPVSLTSVMCKLCEKVIKKRWIDFLEKEEMLNKRQFGFREGSSCVMNLLSFYSRVTDVIQERDGWVDCVYLDLKKAFDTVSHRKLLFKLKTQGGVDGKLLSWMENYLKGRQMRTVIRDKMSKWRNVTSGVPQGSVLAPIMFLK